MKAIGKFIVFGGLAIVCSIVARADVHIVNVAFNGAVVSKEIDIQKQGDYRAVVNVIKIDGTQEIKPAEFPFEFRIFGPCGFEHSGKQFWPSKPVTSFRAQGHGFTWFYSPTPGKYRLECSGEKYGGTAEIVLQSVENVHRFTTGIGLGQQDLFKEVNISRSGRYRIWARASEVHGKPILQPHQVPFEFRVLGPCALDTYGHPLWPTQPVAVCREQGYGVVCCYLPVPGQYRFGCFGQNYGGTAEIMLEPVLPVVRQMVFLRTNNYSGEIIGTYKGPAYGISDDQWLDLLYMGSRKNEGGGRDDMVLYLRLSSTIHGTGWGTGTDPAHNGGLYELARLPHTMLFQTAVKGHPMPGVFEATIGLRQFVLSIIDVSLTYGSPGMPPQWHEFMVTAELLQYNIEDD